MRLRFLTGLALAFAVASFAAPAIAQQKEAGKASDAPAGAQQMSKEQMAAMEEMMKLGTPGEEHKLLGNLVGEWTMETKMWMAPGAPPQESKGTSSKKLALGGRYLTEEVTGDMAGAPFHGMAMTGYDNHKKRFIGTWVDDMSTAVMVSEGTYDPATKTLTMTANMYDPMVQKDVPVRMVTRVVDPNTHVFEYWGIGPDGKEMKALEITYRKKA